MLLHGKKFRRFFQRAAKHEDERNYYAADEERNSPSPGRDRISRHRLTERKADNRGSENGHLLACGLERGVKALVAGGGNLEQIDRHAAEFDSSGEAL